MQSIGAMLEHTARKHPENMAIVFEDAALAYNRLNEAVNRLANGLKNLGVKKGDRVMVQLTNGLEIIMAHYAIIKAGAIAVPLNVMYVAHEIQYIGRDTTAGTVILESGFLKQFEEIRSDLPELNSVIVLGDRVPDSEHHFKDLISGPARQPDSAEAILMTSSASSTPPVQPAAPKGPPRPIARSCPMLLPCAT